jgi:hypothetical protein
VRRRAAVGRGVVGAARRVSRLLGVVAALCATWLPGGCALAEDSSQLWPELGVFVGLAPRTRFFFDLPYSVEGDTENRSLEIAAYFDISLKPVLRRSLSGTDWARSRYFWMRLGFDHIFNVTNGRKDEPENRGVIEFRGRAPLPWEIWLEARERVDLRWIGGEFSTRYRFRLELSREFDVRGRAVVPYVNYEWFFDSRYDEWTRTLLQAGTEITFTDHFRFEVYLAKQDDDVPRHAGLYALGLFAKSYY